MIRVIQDVQREQVVELSGQKSCGVLLLDLTATQKAGLLKLNRKTVNALYQRFRLLICLQRMSERRAFRGVVEVDECYFGPSGAVARSSSPSSASSSARGGLYANH